MEMGGIVYRVSIRMTDLRTQAPQPTQAAVPNY
jgi:hypothetical protein